MMALQFLSRLAINKYTGNPRRQEGSGINSTNLAVNSVVMSDTIKFFAIGLK
jgi:hypothetical protein